VKLEANLGSAGTRRRTVPVSSPEPVLAISGLTVGTPQVDLVVDVNLSLQRGETLCLVGESGCGKSITCLAAMGLTSSPVEVKAGQVLFFERDLMALSERALADLRGRDLAMIFQDAPAALNPVRRVGDQVAEVLVVHENMSRGAALAAATELFSQVGISDPFRCSRSYPHQLSGGMCQRVMIAMALACRPRVIIADEATTALDVTTQAQILHLLRKLQTETGAAMIFVTHDLGVVAEIADRVAVMYSGRVVELATADELFETPQHPYTQGLMASRLHVGSPARGRLAAIEGSVPSPAARPPGCAFRTRCPRAAAICATLPPLAPVIGHHLAACYFPGAAA
jgi:oligopeptide/dipeptide ABC transporter ATP-binding protein